MEDVKRGCIASGHDCLRHKRPFQECMTEAKVRDEKVDHPTHYNVGKIEVIAAIEDWKLGFHLGNVIKYVARAAHKGSTLEDLKKASWYLERYIKQQEGQL